MKIEIQKQKRKTIVLKMVDAEKAILKVPTNLSESKICEFIDSKKKWLEKMSLKLKNNENLSDSFDFLKFIYLNGEKAFSTNKLVMGFDNLSKSEKIKTIQKYYLSMFYKLEDLTKNISKFSGLFFKEIKSTDSVRIWGSYNSKGQLKLNWKLILLPEKLAEYVVCHELCHSKHMNHKPQFWKEVQRICPDFKTLKKELASYSFLLKSAVI